MALPEFQTLFLPALRQFEDGQPHTLSELRAALAHELALTPEELEQRYPHGRQTIFYNLVYTAAAYLHRAGLIQRIGRGEFQICDRGYEVLRDQPATIDIEYLTQFADRATLRNAPLLSTLDSPNPRASRRRRSKSARKRAKSTPSRPTLFRQILSEANEPLHYSEIYARALSRAPSDKTLTKRLTYASLFSNRAFRLIGNGVFALAERDRSDASVPTETVTSLENGEVAFLKCPRPLTPEPATPRAFFDSIIFGRMLLQKAPQLTARRFYMHMREWAKLPALDLNDAQSAFDAWYAAGVFPRLDFAQSLDLPLQLTLPVDAALVALRSYCLEMVCRRVTHMPELLYALTRLPQPTVAGLRETLFGQTRSNAEVARRLNMLLAFEAVTRDRDIWRITRTGEVQLAAYSTHIWTLFSDDEGGTKALAEGTGGGYDAQADGLLDDLLLSPSEGTIGLSSREQQREKINRLDGDTQPVDDPEATQEFEAVHVSLQQNGQPTPSPLDPALSASADHGIDVSDAIPVDSDMAASTTASVAATSSVSLGVAAPTWTQEELQRHMREALVETVQILFPVGVDPNTKVIRHDWRNPTYVGESNGKVSKWQGWSVNLTSVDSGYGTAYVDYVSNNLPLETQNRLFGKEFAIAIEGLSSFVVIFVAGLDHADSAKLKDSGYTIRVIGKTVHACILAEPHDFLSQPTLVWAAKLARLLNLKRLLQISAVSRVNSPQDLLSNPKAATASASSKNLKRGGLGAWIKSVILGQ